jgi:hypothetical protein
LVSAKEERDLAALLDLFALGVGDVDEFQERLQAELAALEVSTFLMPCRRASHGPDSFPLPCGGFVCFVPDYLVT